MPYNPKKILEVYREQAKIHGDKGESTIQDIRTRQLEIQALFQYIDDDKVILEVGCGNGYVAEKIACSFNVEIDAIDFSPEMIEIAKKRNLEGIKGKVNFKLGNILELTDYEKYDIIFTERCIQNIMDWELQKEALKNISKSLKKNGKFIMLESFTDSYEYLNTARKELDLPEVPVPHYNLPLDKENVKQYLKKWLNFEHENRFLSGYYFGTRIIYPAILPKGKEPSNDSVIKDYFVNLPVGGDFSPMKILLFKKYN